MRVCEMQRKYNPDNSKFFFYSYCVDEFHTGI